MFNNTNILFSALLKYLIPFLVFIKEKESEKADFLVSSTKYKCLELKERNFHLINNGYWYLIITDDIKKSKEKIDKLLKFINVAVLEVNSFEKAIIASKFQVSFLPKDFVIFDGKINQKFHKNCKIYQPNLWDSIDIYLSVLFSYYYDLFGKFFIKLINEGGVTVYRYYDFGGRSFFNFVIIF